MYGGRQFSTYDRGWVGWFCQKAAKAAKDRDHAPFTISGNGKQVRDVLHAIDMVRLYFTALEKIDSAAGQAFNIGGGLDESLSLLELFTMLESMTGVPLAYIHLPVRQSDQKVFIADIGKASQLLSWQPKVSCEDGVERMLEWVSRSSV